MKMAGTLVLLAAWMLAAPVVAQVDVEAT